MALCGFIVVSEDGFGRRCLINPSLSNSPSVPERWYQVAEVGVLNKAEGGGFGPQPREHPLSPRMAGWRRWSCTIRILT